MEKQQFIEKMLQYGQTIANQESKSLNRLALDMVSDLYDKQMESVGALKSTGSQFEKDLISDRVVINAECTKYVIIDVRFAGKTISQKRVSLTHLTIEPLTNKGDFTIKFGTL